MFSRLAASARGGERGISEMEMDVAEYCFVVGESGLAVEMSSTWVGVSFSIREGEIELGPWESAFV